MKCYGYYHDAIALQRFVHLAIFRMQTRVKVLNNIAKQLLMCTISYTKVLKRAIGTAPPCNTIELSWQFLKK
eukprot:3219589-Pleurochrysis_carterae.AAC.6